MKDSTTRFIEYLESLNKKFGKEIRTTPIEELPILEAKIKLLGEIQGNYFKTL